MLRTEAVAGFNGEKMTDIIVGLILIGLVALVIRSMRKAKKSGRSCMGCPNEGQCRNAGK